MHLRQAVILSEIEDVFMEGWIAGIWVVGRWIWTSGYRAWAQGVCRVVLKGLI